MYIDQNGTAFHMNVTLADYFPFLEKIKKHKDKSIFKFGHRFIHQHDKLEKFLTSQGEQGNQIVFPEKDPRTIFILDKDEETCNKYFMIYDVF